MKLQLNTNLIPIFSGTYGTNWEVTECNDDGDELELDYKHEDLMRSIMGVYQENSKDIVKDLGVKFIKSIKFDGVFSPREYNFKTDQLDFTLTINLLSMMGELKALKDNKEFSKFLHDNYTSYDGFMSFTPNNYKELRLQILEGDSEHDQSISALITFLSKDNIKEIEGDILEDWGCNGYGGLDYKIVEEQ